MMAFFVRINLFTGMIRGDDFVYAHSAYELSQGHLVMDAQGGNNRLAQFAPVALFYSLFGVSDATTLAHPLICSLLSVIFIYGLTRLYGGESAGLVAASIWALLPMDIFLSTDLLPDGPMTAFSTGAVFFLLLGERYRGSRRIFFWFCGVVFLAWALLIKPLSAITVFFFIFYFACLSISAFWNKHGRELFQNRSLKKKLVLFFGIVLLAFFIFYVSTQHYPYSHFFVLQLEETATDAIELLINNLTIWYLAPIFILSILWFFQGLTKSSISLAGWLGFVYLYYEWGSINTNPLVFDPINRYFDFRNFLFVLAPIVTASGLYLSQKTDIKIMRRIIMGLALLMITLACIFTRSPMFHPVLLKISSSCSLLVILGGMLSPLFTSLSHDHRKSFFLTTLLLCTGLSVFARYTETLDTYAYLRLPRLNLQDAAQYLETQPELPIYVYDRASAVSLNYFSDFTFGFDHYNLSPEKQRIQIALPEDTELQDGYALVTGNTLANVPSSWHELTVFDRAGPYGESYLLKIYRAQNQTKEAK